MRHRFFLAKNQADFNDLEKLFDEGWEKEKVYSTESDFLISLTLAENNDDPITTAKGEFDDVTDVISVEILNNEKIQEKYKEGYRVQALYAKTVTMIRRAIPLQVKA